MEIGQNGQNGRFVLMPMERMFGKDQKPEIAPNRSMEGWYAMDQIWNKNNVLQVCLKKLHHL